MLLALVQGASLYIYRLAPCTKANSFLINIDKNMKKRTNFEPMSFVDTSDQIDAKKRSFTTLLSHYLYR